MTKTPEAIQSPPDDPIRQAIKRTYDRNPDLIDGIGGVTILDFCDKSRSFEMDCVSFVFPESRNPVRAVKKLRKTPWSTTATEGDIAIYVNPNDIFMHAGVVVEDGGEQKIISKWGFGGNIHLHDPWAVLPLYGTMIKYYKYPEPGILTRLRQKASRFLAAFDKTQIGAN